MRNAWDKKEVRMFHKELKTKGFMLNRTNGSHDIYKNNKTGKTITVNKNLNKMVMQRLKKELELL